MLAKMEKKNGERVNVSSSVGKKVEFISTFFAFLVITCGINGQVCCQYLGN